MQQDEDEGNNKGNEALDGIDGKEPEPEEEDSGPFEDPEEANLSLKTNCDFAVVLHFFDLFKHVLQLGDLTADALEHAILHPIEVMEEM